MTLLLRCLRDDGPTIETSSVHAARYGHGPSLFKKRLSSGAQSGDATVINEIDRIARHLWLLAGEPTGGPGRFNEEATQVIERQRAVQLKLKALAGYDVDIPEPMRQMLSEHYGL